MDKAATLPVPKTVTLKDPKAFKVLGQSLPRLDVPEKVNGTAEFGIDVKLPGLLTARVVRCPVFGGKVASFNADKAKAITGVTHVVQISGGIAVVAENYWAASQGAQALQVTWDEGPLANLSSADINKKQAELAQQPGKVARNDGNAEAALDPRPLRSDRTAGTHVRARLRSAVPRARVHGADELHGRREGGQLRRLRADAGADRVAAGGDGRVEAAGRQGEGPHHLHGRRVRPAR